MDTCSESLRRQVESIWRLDASTYRNAFIKQLFNLTDIHTDIVTKTYTFLVYKYRNHIQSQRIFANNCTTTIKTRNNEKKYYEWLTVVHESDAKWATSPVRQNMYTMSQACRPATGAVRQS